MTNPKWIAAAGLLALAGCGGGERGDAAANGAGNAAGSGNAAGAAAPDEPAAAAADQVRLQPGEWEIRVETKTSGIPGMPEGMAKAMKDTAVTTKTCLTEDDVAKPAVFTGNEDPGCRTEGFAANGGKVSGTVTCPGEGGRGGMVMKTDGQFTPTGFESTTRSEIDAEGMKMTTEARVTGRRIGECHAGPEDFKGKTRVGG